MCVFVLICKLIRELHELHIKAFITYIQFHRSSTSSRKKTLASENGNNNTFFVFFSSAPVKAVVGENENSVYSCLVFQSNLLLCVCVSALCVVFSQKIFFATMHSNESSSIFWVHIPFLYFHFGKREKNLCHVYCLLCRIFCNCRLAKKIIVIFSTFSFDKHQ